MLNVEKVKLMCQLALFEEKEGKEVFETNRFYKSDYVSKNLFRALVHYTLGFLLLLLIASLLKMNDIFSLLSLEFLKQGAGTLIVLYLLGFLLVAITGHFTFSAKYDEGYRMKLYYNAKLEKLRRMGIETIGEPETGFHSRIDSKRSIYRTRSREQTQVVRGQSRGKKGRKARK